jgi:hypothetical protein
MNAKVEARQREREREKRKQIVQNLLTGRATSSAAEDPSARAVHCRSAAALLRREDWWTEEAP